MAGKSVVPILMASETQAFAYLHKAYLRHSSSLNAIKVDPIYDPLRADPRFQDLLRQLGLS